MKENELLITYKKSPVKLGKNKTLLFEVKCSWEQNSTLFFTNRDRYADIINDKSVAVEIVRTIGNLSSLIDSAKEKSATIKVKRISRFISKTYVV